MHNYYTARTHTHARYNDTFTIRSKAELNSTEMMAKPCRKLKSHRRKKKRNEMRVFTSQMELAEGVNAGGQRHAVKFQYGLGGLILLCFYGVCVVLGELVYASNRLAWLARLFVCRFCS